ncbi:MAG TPA: glycosyltransferase 87 family protein [Terracidiphilus sp.]|nr:glycosyltransferase 87 family protein [Terracidiphilus sp.]
MASRTDVPLARPDIDFAELSIATVGGLALALIAMFLCVVPLAGNITSGRDFVVFWATGQQLIHHANPYDAAAIGKIERTAGLNPGYGILFMRNPPWALPLVLLLGLIGLRVGALLWSLVLLACMMVSAWLIWLVHGRPGNRIHWLALSFAPALICFFMGQTALFALLGLVLFLWLHRTQPFIAGLALWLCALKPHLFLPFGVVLLAWVIVSRSYKILAGVAGALTASCAAAWLMDPLAWRDYSNMMSAPEIEKEFIPCLSVAVRLWLSPQTVWLQYLPVALACAWALAYYWRRRDMWDWMKDGSVLMLVSVLAAPYCWLYDQAVVIPALLQGAYSTRSRPLLAAIALVNIPIMAALMCSIKIAGVFYLWTAPAWLAWYLLALASRGEPSIETESSRLIVDSDRGPEDSPGARAEEVPR